MLLVKNIETFIVHVIFLLKKAIYLAKKAQIAFLLTKKVIILKKYFSFSDIFLKKKVLILPKITKLN